MTSRKSNEVFSGQEVPPALQQHMNRIAELSGQVPGQQQSQVSNATIAAADSFTSVLAREFGFEIITESIPLPSKGLYYTANHPFHMKDTVEIKPMTSKEEDILTSQSILKKGTVVSELLRSTLIDNVDPADLLIGDRNALMVAVRITGYGHQYDGKIQCSGCGESSDRQFNLAALEIKQPTLQPVAPGQNEFEFRFSRYNNVPVRFRFLTGHDEEEIMRSAEIQKKKLNIQTESLVSTRLLYSLVSINGISDRSKLAQFVKVLPARESSELRKYMDDNMPGVQMKQMSVCPLCGHEEEVTIPIGVNFLWPNAER